MKTAIIDLDSVAFTIGHPNKVLDALTNQPIKEDGKFVYYDKTEQELKRSADTVMRGILFNSQATHFIGYLKGEGTTKERKIINPEYKANRSGEAPTWWKFVLNDLHTRWGAHYVNDMEVDDAVRITAKRLPDSFICAIDGDLLGLEGTHFNWRTKEWITKTKAEARYKFWSDMVTGQTGDNIKGIAGKGPKFVTQLFIAGEGQISYTDLVFSAYLDRYGEHEGIKEFYRNYISLFILQEHPDFQIPIPTEFKPQVTFS